MGRRAQTLTQLVDKIRPIPYLLTLVERPADFDASILDGLNIPTQYLATAIRDFQKTALDPYWKYIYPLLEAECSNRGQVALNGGIEQLFATLPDGFRWSAPVLEIPSEESREITLTGTGLVLTPSLFLADRPAIFIDSATSDEPPTVVFPITVEAEAVTALWSASQPDPRHALGALIGHTRATIMYTLVDGCATKELARRVGISAAAVSQHTAALRQSGLITTHRRLITTNRRQNTVLHTLTPLGVALITQLHRPDPLR